MIQYVPRLALRVALFCATLLGLAAIPLASTASATPASCTTTSNPLGAATGYTEFIKGSGSRGSESEGAIAWGGNLSAGGMTVGTRLPSSTPASYPAIVVAGTHGSFNLQKGSAYLNPKSGVNFNGGAGTGYLATNPIDFTAAFNDLQTKSTAWGAAASTGTVTTGVTGGNAATILTGTNADLNVFNVTQADFPSGRHIGLDIPAGSVALINVAGTSITLSGQMWIKVGGNWNQANDNVMANYPGVLWNFPDATNVTINVGSAWGGSILAPKAALNIASAGHTIGQMIAASFTSNFETHQNTFPSTACLPGGGGPTPPTPTSADVQITKTASSTTPKGGSQLIYSLTVKNSGPDTAKDVKASDTLPLGTTFDWASTDCTVSGVIVTCAAGDLANGASKTYKIGVIANPIGSAGGSLPHPGQQHNLTVSKVESQVDLNPGESKTVQISCPASGAILSDASIRVDAVDQGTGTLTDVHVTRAQSTGIASWAADVTNGATGRAQAKAFAVCLPASTESAGGHQHSLVAANTLATTTQAFGVGRGTATVSCPAGTMPIVPGYAFSGGAATIAGSEPTTGGWRFTVDATAATDATLSVRCLNTNVDPADGHTHALVTNHVVQTVNVPAGQTVEGQVICADDAKGIVGTWTLPSGVSTVGNDPRPKTRAYKLVNTTGSDQTATIDLECLNDRTGPEKISGGATPVGVSNTATVSSTTTDPTPGNNSSTAAVTVQPGKIVALGSAATAGSSKLTVKAIASVDGHATITVKSKTGTVWASGTVMLTAGVAKTVQLDLTSDGQSALGSSTKLGKGIIEISGQTNYRLLTIKPA